MKFNNGYFGACIVVLALLGTAISGFVLNIEKDTREVTNYDYVADVSGLFSYTDAPEYIDYNPSTNLNGYDDDVVYTPSNVVNNYRYKISDGSSTALTCPNIRGTDTNPLDYGPFQTNQIVAFNPNPIQEGPLNVGAVDHKAGGMKFTDYLNRLSIAQYDTVELNLTYNNPYPVFFYPDGWTFYTIPIHLPSGDTSVEAWTNDTPLTYERNNPTKLVIQTNSNLVSAYNGSTLLWSNTADNVGVFAWYIVGNQNADTGVDITGVGISPASYGYMNPNAGVKAKSTGATWTNGYENSVIDLKIIKNGDESVGTGQILNLSIPKNNYLGTWFLLQFIYNNSGFHVQYNDGTQHIIDLGGWLGVQVRIDALNGDVILTPTNDLNLLTTVQPTDYSTVIEDCIDGQIKTSFKVSKVGDAPSLKFQVTDTKVFLNTYNTVMVDPTLRISDYFPEYSEYRLNFYSFAILGDSITINNKVCTVNKEDGTITFRNVADFEFTKKLANIYLTFENGHTYLTFVNDSSVYDLGETVNSVVSFSGMWYFTTGLYKANPGLETYWNLDLDGMFHATAGECLLIFIGIIGAGIIVYTVWGRGKLGVFDWLVVIFAVFLGSCVLGF